MVLFMMHEGSVVLRLSKLTDYAVVVMARLARDGALPEGRVQTAPGLAQATGIAEPTVAKVLKILGQAGLVEGVRGARKTGLHEMHGSGERRGLQRGPAWSYLSQAKGQVPC